MKSIRNIAMMGASFAALLSSGQAFAQAADEEDADPESITVIGTLIRGTEVVGSQTVSIDTDDIAARGAVTTNELLGAIPQIANAFNGRFERDPRGIQGAGASINRPNLRNLPSSDTTSGALSLVLVDGLRLTPVGVNQSSIDVDVVPAAVLQGVDIVTDGGSSLYGADAVGGVINFRTLTKFEGIKLDVNHGYGTTLDSYKFWDGAITAGTSWATGNAYVSAGYAKRNEVLNGDVPWSTGLVYNALGVGAFNYRECPNPVGTETRWLRFGPGAAQFTNNPLAAGAGSFPVGTACDGNSAQSYSPQQKRKNLFAQVSQEFGDNMDLRVTGYWTKRDTQLSVTPRGGASANSPLNTGALVGQAFPNAAVGSITVIPGGTSFSFGTNPAYVNTPQRVGFETWGVTPELTVKLGTNWQLRNSLHFGKSDNFSFFPGVDSVKIAAAITAGTLNPFNAGAASAAVVNDITNYASQQDTKQQLFTLRSVLDGSLFAMPAGDVKVAVGVEYQDARAQTRLTAGPFGTLSSVAYNKNDRNAKSVFGELLVPITSFLDITGSVRLDDYSDFGSTTNPSLGFSLKPTDWFRVFGHWNTSFNAPTTLDNLAVSTGRFACGIYVAGSTNPAQRPTDQSVLSNGALPLRDTSRQGNCAMVLQGSTRGLKPQTAEAWAVGFEATPGDVFRFGANYYSIDVDDALGTLNPSITSTYLTNPDLYTYNVTAAQYSTILASLANGTALGLQQPSSNIAIIVDTRITNLNAAQIEGLDFNASVDLGAFGMGIAGNRQTKAFITNGGVGQDRLGIGGPKLRASAYFTYDAGILSSRLTFNYSGRFIDDAINNRSIAETAETFITTNLNIGLDLAETVGMKGLSLRLGVDNLFDEQPQRVKRLNTNNPSFLNWTLGRVVKLGASVHF